MAHAAGQFPTEGKHRAGGDPQRRKHAILIAALLFIIGISNAGLIDGEINITANETQNLTIPPDGNLSSANSTYALTAPRLTGQPIYLSGEGAVLDCNNFELRGLNTRGQYAIYNFARNTEVRNCRTGNYWGGIYSDKPIRINGGFLNATNKTIHLEEGASGSIVRNIVLDPAICIQLNGTDNSVFANFSCSDITSIGLYLHNQSNNNTFVNFTIQATEISGGVRAILTSDNSVNNTFDCQGRAMNMSWPGSLPDAFQPAIYASAPSNTFKNCIISNWTRAIDIYDVSNVFVNNTISNPAGHGDALGGAYCAFATDNTIANNTFNFTTGGVGSYGIWLDGCERTSIANNIIHTHSNSGVVMISGDNNTIDCSPSGLILGSNISGTFGLQTFDSQTTIKNCQVRNYDSAVYFHSAFGGRILNVSASSTRNNYVGPTYSGAIVLYSGSSSSIVENSTGNSTFGPGIWLNSAGTGINVSNSHGITRGDSGISCVGATELKITNSNATSTGNFAAIYMGSCHNSLLSNIRAIGNDTAGAILVGNHRTNISNSFLSSNVGAALRVEDSQNNTFINNTLISNFTLAWLYGTSSRNLFYWNNFTNSIGRYVNDTNGSNFYNTTRNATQQVFSTNYSSAHAIPLNNLDATAMTSGGCITPNFYQKLKNITRSTNTNAIYACVMNSTGGFLAQSSFSGNLATFDYVLNPGTSYCLVVSNDNNCITNSSNRFTLDYSDGSVFPVNQVAVNWTTGVDSGLYGAVRMYAITQVGTAGLATENYTGAEGNIWHNVLNGSVNITGASVSGYSPLFYSGNAGTGYPYNQTTSLGKFLCPFNGCGDYAPLTPSQLLCLTIGISYSSGMTPTGLFFTRSESPTWLLQLFNGSYQDVSCFLNYTARVFTANGTLVSTISSTNPTATQLNNTGVPTNQQIYTNVSIYGVGGLFNVTETRTYTILFFPSPQEAAAGEDISWLPLLMYGVLFTFSFLATVGLGRDFIKSSEIR